MQPRPTRLPLPGSNQRPFRARKLSRCTTGRRPAAHRSVSGPASASLHRPPGALGSGAVNSRPAPFVRAAGSALLHPASSCGRQRTGSLPLCKRKSAPVTRCSGKNSHAERTNDHSEPGNCRAAPRAAGPRPIALFPGPPPPRCIAHWARSAPAQLTAAPRHLFVLPVLLCFTPPVLAAINAQGRCRFAKEKAHRLPDALFSGSPCWARTNDPAVNSRMLYRLS